MSTEESGTQQNKIEIDYLTEDNPIPGQEYGVYSFLSPEGIKGCNIRAFKNRGNFGSWEEACAYAEKIRNEEPAFHVFAGENFKWTAFDPDPNMIKNNNNYYESELQDLMKGTLENQEKARQLEAQRKRTMIEESIKEEIRKKSGKESTRDRLRKKLEKKNKKKEHTSNTVDSIITDELNKHKTTSEKSESVKLTDEQLEKKKEEVSKLSESINTIDENLEKMKKLYADMIKKKNNST